MTAEPADEVRSATAAGTYDRFHYRKRLTG
jgi:hypothetical protein